MFESLRVGASSLTAQRLRMDVASSNIANAQTTRATINEDGEYEPYQRKMVHVQPNTNNFKSFLHKSTHGTSSPTSGIKVNGIVRDQSPFNIVHDPTHPDANEEGYVSFPNVDPLKETIDMMGATRSYEANVTALNASKDMLLKALEIGK